MPRRPTNEHANHERWLVSYADFITLLFAFFVVMYAISAVDIKKLQLAVKSFRQAFNRPNQPGSVPLTGGVGTLPIIEGDFNQGLVELLPPALDETFRSEREQTLLQNLGRREQTELQTLGETIQEALQQSTEAKKLLEMVRFYIDERGLVMSLAAKYFFDSGKAALHPDVLPIIDEISRIVKPLDREIRIEGHTDDVPIQTAIYPSNWELSAARATYVIKYMADKFGIPASRLSAAGYGEFRPIATNTTPDGKARNRRVDIVVLSRTILAGQSSIAPVQPEVTAGRSQ